MAYDTINATQQYDHFMSCIYDIRQNLLNSSHLAFTPTQLVETFGPHWATITIQQLINDDYAYVDGTKIDITKKSETRLWAEALIPPLPKQNNLNDTDKLQTEVQELVKAYDVRVLPGYNPFNPNEPANVGISANCFDKRPEQYVTELAKAGYAILTHGGYGIHISTAKQSMSNRPHITVLAVANKPPRTDITVEEIYDVCVGTQAALKPYMADADV